MRRPNVEERVLLKQIGVNPKHFLRLDKDWESYTFIQIVTGKKLLVRR
jgi:hypothetical protein